MWMQACNLSFCMNTLLHSLQTAYASFGHHSMASIFVHTKRFFFRYICFKLIDGGDWLWYQRSHVRQYENEETNIFLTDRHLLGTGPHTWCLPPLLWLWGVCQLSPLPHHPSSIPYSTPQVPHLFTKPPLLSIVSIINKPNSDARKVVYSPAYMIDTVHIFIFFVLGDRGG